MHRKLTGILFGARVRRQTTVARRRGFTSTEVVVASALLIVAITPILKGLTTAHLGSTIIEHKTRSLLLAQGKLDEIRARSIYGYDSSYSQSNASLDGAYLCSVTDSGPGDDLRTVAVSVGCDVNGDAFLSADEVRVTLTTLIARRWGD